MRNDARQVRYAATPSIWGPENAVIGGEGVFDGADVAEEGFAIDICRIRRLGRAQRRPTSHAPNGGVRSGRPPGR
jgi:hypothetical protein